LTPIGRCGDLVGYDTRKGSRVLNVCLIRFPEPPVNPVISGIFALAAYVKSVPETLEVRFMLHCCFEQIVWLGGEMITFETGCTVTV